MMFARPTTMLWRPTSWSLRLSPLSGVTRRSFTTAGAPPPQLKGWRKYAAQFKDKPATFLILHEVTAIAPIGVFYYGIQWTGIAIPFPESLLEESNAKIQRVIKYYGWDIQPDSRVFVNLVASYAIVKMLMPVRIAASVAMTPAFARVIDRVSAPIQFWKKG
ncbi:hypothetical protein BC828DRAFT_406405 [Blastocladiella britannica]|nr:hypothetical protein BC828DRAFT_406405 [Blastocladiella britannica]